MDSGTRRRGLISKPCATIQARVSFVAGRAARTSVVCLRPPVRAGFVCEVATDGAEFVGVRVAQIHLEVLVVEGDGQSRRSVPAVRGEGVHNVHTRGLGSGRTRLGLPSIRIVSPSSHCQQGLESGSSRTLGTLIRRSEAFWLLSPSWRGLVGAT
jgi:hypothetical protein